MNFQRNLFTMFCVIFIVFFCTNQAYKYVAKAERRDLDSRTYYQMCLMISGTQASAEVIVVSVGQQRVRGDQRNCALQPRRVAVPQSRVKRTH